MTLENHNGLFQIWEDRNFIGLADISITWESVADTNFNLVVDLEWKTGGYFFDGSRQFIARAAGHNYITSMEMTAIAERASLHKARWQVNG